MPPISRKVRNDSIRDWCTAGTNNRCEGRSFQSRLSLEIELDHLAKMLGAGRADQVRLADLTGAANDEGLAVARLSPGFQRSAKATIHFGSINEPVLLCTV